MNWELFSLHDLLKVSKVYITVLDKGLYPTAALQTYPIGLNQRAIKRGTDFRTKLHKTLRAGQFVISKLHVQQRYWGIVQPELDGTIVHRSYLSFDLQPDLQPNYFVAYLSTSSFRHAVFGACTRQGRLDIRRFGRIFIPLPPLADQNRIAETWEYAHKALKHTADMRVSISDVKTGVAGDLFRKIEALSVHRPLGRCALIGDNLSTDYPIYISNLGKFVRGKHGLEDQVIGIMPDADLDYHFLQYYLESQKQAWYPNNDNTPVNMLSALQALPIPLSALYEQRKIVSILQQHDEVLQKLKIEYAELQNLTQGIIQQLFKGNLPPIKAISLL